MSSTRALAVIECAVKQPNDRRKRALRLTVWTRSELEILKAAGFNESSGRLCLKRRNIGRAKFVLEALRWKRRKTTADSKSAPAGFISVQELKQTMAERKVCSRKWPINVERLACQRATRVDSDPPNLNGHITRVFKELAAIYESLTRAPTYSMGGAVKRKGNTYVWKLRGAKKAVALLERLPYRLRTRKQVIELTKSNRGFGKKTCEKVCEILRTGRLGRLDKLTTEPKVRALKELRQIWGVGPAKAAELYARGFTSVSDLRRAGDSVPLDRNARVGLRVYEDLLERMPRAEVEEIWAVVSQHATVMLPQVKLTVCGSYRRGKSDCGDVDILITCASRDPPDDFLHRLVERLCRVGFVTDVLSGGPDTQSFMGVCRLGPRRLHRRLDLKVYHKSTFAFALLYFTGSDHFNRSMRWYAKRKGLTLSDKGLAMALRRRGEKLARGRNVYCETEREIFEALGLTYVPPEQRTISAAPEPETSNIELASAGSGSTTAH